MSAGHLQRTLTHVAVAFVPALAVAQSAVIDGMVTDADLRPLADANVTMLGTRIPVATGDNGRFRILSTPAGSYILVVHRLGHVPASMTVQVQRGDTLRVSFTLDRIARVLDTVATTTQRFTERMSEFESRRRLAFGHFLTQADIEKRQAISVTDLLRPVLSVQILSSPFGEIALGMREACPYQIFVDRVPVVPTPPNLLNLPAPSTIAAMEISSGPATIPLEYKRADSRCGIILIWTKGGS